MSYSHDYSNRYHPSNPVIEILVGPALRSPQLALTAIVDSGADATIVPFHYLRQIQARRSKTLWLRGITSERTLVDLYKVSLRFGSYHRTQVEVVADTQGDETIVGRDLLNQFIVTLNGLASVVEITQ